MSQCQHVIAIGKCAVIAAAISRNRHVKCDVQHDAVARFELLWQRDGQDAVFERQCRFNRFTIGCYRCDCHAAIGEIGKQAQQNRIEHDIFVIRIVNLLVSAESGQIIAERQLHLIAGCSVEFGRNSSARC